MIEEPFVQELLAKERNDAKEQSFGLSFLVTDTQGREEDYFGNRDTGKCSKTSLSKYPLQEETIPGSSNLSGRNKKRCNARGYKSLSLLCEK